MKNRQETGVLVLCFVVLCAPLHAQDVSSAASAHANAPTLTIGEAVQIAVSQNRLVKNASLEADKFDYRVHTLRSRRLPQFNVAVLGGMLLNPLDFTFPAGLFGVYPGVGPIPGRESTITTPRRPSVLSLGSIDQPLTQQYKIGLGIRAQELGREIAREEERLQRQKIEANVRSAYFDMVATQSGIEAARRAVVTLQEAKTVAQRYEAERVILKSDLLDIESRLAKQEYQLEIAVNGFATHQEHLNQLLGRDIATPFRVVSASEEDPTSLSLDAARQHAIANRPEIRQAKLKQQQAEYAKRIAKADRVPDLSLSVRYFGVSKVEFVPHNYASAGFFLSWEPFDWGRRRDNVAEQSKTVDQAKNGVAEAESQVAVEVGMRYRKWREAVLLLRSSELTQQARAEQLRVANNKFKENAALVKDVLQAEAQSSEADFQYQQALSQYWSALAELRKAMGEE